MRRKFVPLFAPVDYDCSPEQTSCLRCLRRVNMCDYPIKIWNRVPPDKFFCCLFEPDLTVRYKGQTDEEYLELNPPKPVVTEVLEEEAVDVEITEEPEAVEDVMSELREIPESPVQTKKRKG